jgi:ketosteroid isomerase-like protein
MRGVYQSPQAVLENVFAKIQVDFESFSVDVERLIDAGNVVVMQGHYVATGKATGKSVRAAVAHVLEISDGKTVRFDQYVDSATINPIAGA